MRPIYDFQELTDYGASVAPEKATVEQGQKMKHVRVNYLTDLVKRMDRQNWRFTGK